MERLDTTNLILIVVAIASVIQTVVVVTAVVATYRAYQEAARVLETTVAPALTRLETTLASLERTSAAIRSRTDDVGRTLETVQGATRLGAVLGPRAAVLAGVAGGVLGVVRRWRDRRRARANVTVVAG